MKGHLIQRVHSDATPPSYLASARHLQAIHRSGDLNALDLAILAALVPDVLHNLLVFLVIQQLLWGHHVH